MAGLVLRLMCTTDYRGRRWTESEAVLELERLVQAQAGGCRTLQRFCRTVRRCPAFAGWGPAPTPGDAEVPPRPPAPNDWPTANRLIGELAVMVGSDIQLQWYGFPATPTRPPRPPDWQPGQELVGGYRFRD